MNTYWHHHDRGFANLCTMVRAATKDEEQWLAAHGFERLTRKDAAAHARWVNGENEAWGSNSSAGSIDTVALFSADADHQIHGYEAYAAAGLVTQSRELDERR
jgi:hypothetical protein